MFVNYSEQDRYAMLMEGAPSRMAKKSPKIFRKIHDSKKYPSKTQTWSLSVRTQGTSTIRIPTRGWRNGCGVCGWRKRSRPRPARRPGSVHRETGWIPPGRTSENRLFSSRHQCTGKTHRIHVKFTVVRDVDMQLTAAEEIRTIKNRSPKNVGEFWDQCRISTMLTAPVCGRQSYRKFWKSSQTSMWSSPQQCCWNSWRWDRTESVLRLAVEKSDDSAPAYIRATQGHCSRPTVRSKHRVAGRITFIVPVPSSTLTKFCWLVCLQHEQAGKKADKHVTSRPRILNKAKQYVIRKVGNHRPFSTFITSGMRTQFLKLIWSKHKTWGLKFNHTVSDAVDHFVHVPTECIARDVGHDQTVLLERRSKVAPHAPAIEADVRASGDRLLDPNQQQKNFKCSSQKRTWRTTSSVSKKMVRRWTRTAELYSKQGSTDITEVGVFEETTQCEKCQAHNANRKSLGN